MRVWNMTVVEYLKLYQLTSYRVCCISSSRSVIAQLADVSVIAALIVFPVHTPKVTFRPQAIYYSCLCSATHTFTYTRRSKTSDVTFSRSIYAPINLSQWCLFGKEPGFACSHFYQTSSTCSCVGFLFSLSSSPQTRLTSGWNMNVDSV